MLAALARGNKTGEGANFEGSPLRDWTQSVDRDTNSMVTSSIRSLAFAKVRKQTWVLGRRDSLKDVRKKAKKSFLSKMSFETLSNLSISDSRLRVEGRAGESGVERRVVKPKDEQTCDRGSKTNSLPPIASTAIRQRSNRYHQVIHPVQTPEC